MSVKENMFTGSSCIFDIGGIIIIFLIKIEFKHYFHIFFTFEDTLGIFYSSKIC